MSTTQGSAETSLRLPSNLVALLSFIIVVGPVSVDMYLPAFGHIATEFHSQAAPQWTLTAYSIGLALGQITFGPASDRAGRRLPLTLGLSLYVVASLGCALAPAVWFLCLCRALAAFGGAASIVVTRAIVFDVGRDKEAAATLSALFKWVIVVQLVAPPLGSLVLMVADWRAIFVAAALYGAVSLFIVRYLLPETLPLTQRAPMGFGVLVPRFAFILTERRFVSNALVGSFAMAALFTYLGGSADAFLTENKLQPIYYSMVLVVIGTAAYVLLQYNRVLVTRIGTRHAVDLDLAVLLTGSLLLAVTAFFYPYWLLELLALLICTAAFSCLMPNSQPGAIAAHDAHRGSAQSLMSTLQYGLAAVAGAALSRYADGTARPMAVIMLATAVGACAAALLRPRASK